MNSAAGIAMAAMSALFFVCQNVAADSVAASAAAAPLPLAADKWDADPLLWQFDSACGTVSVSATNGNGIAVCNDAPLSGDVVAEAVFVPNATHFPEWCVASVAIVDDEQNYWHVALVRSPLGGDGARQVAELCEMRDGVWLAQQNLPRGKSARAANARWEYGKPYKLSLSLGADGIVGEVTGADGEIILCESFAFPSDKPAVKRGRPALRVSGFTGVFSDVRAESGAAIEREHAAFPPYDAAPVAPEIKSDATGFFRVEEQADGRWWAIDPNGRGTVILGIDHTAYAGHYCEKLGYAPHQRKNDAKYSSRAAWEEETLGRLKAWGFNAFGAGGDRSLHRRGLAHCGFISIGERFADFGGDYEIMPNEHRPCSAFPNVFHPDFERYAKYLAQRVCAPGKDDPWLFGYFIDNELRWWGSASWGGSEGLYNAALAKPDGHPAKTAALALRREDFASDAEMKTEFLRMAAERYFKVCADAIREADPNHLVLGARFAGTVSSADVVWREAAKYCDVVTFNYYPMADLDSGRVRTSLGRGGELIADHFTRYARLIDKPMLVTEWSFPALDSGLPCENGAGQRFRTQSERAEATGLFAREMLALPFLIGYDYFMWVDEPALGISANFPEDSNYGLVNEDGVPYKEITETFSNINHRAAALRFAPPPETKGAGAGTVKFYPLEWARRTHGGQYSFDNLIGHKITKVSRSKGSASFTNGGAFEIVRLEDGTSLFDIIFVNGDGVDGNFGADVGKLNFMAHIIDADGNNRWLAATNSTAEIYTGNPLSIRFNAFGGGYGSSFEIEGAAFLPIGSRAVFFSSINSIKNTGAAPLKLKALFFRLNTDYNETASGGRVPNLWKANKQAAWLDPATGRYLGCFAPAESAMEIHFWADKDGQHPDARYELETPAILAPGEIYIPPDPVFIAIAAGTDGELGWQKASSVK